MNANLKFPQRLVLVAALAAFSSAGAIADKPEWAGNKAAKADKGGAKSDHGDHGHGGFSDDARREVNDYYGTRFKAGKCPPGLAKKNNGCMPPGQAKKWAMGQPLPKDVHYYELPRELILRLPPPPPQHRYVRVAADILLIAIGTSMVIDAIEDIGR
jgi:Ni/Co efflux regulator RcnB